MPEVRTAAPFAGLRARSVTAVTLALLAASLGVCGSALGGAGTGAPERGSQAPSATGHDPESAGYALPVPGSRVVKVFARPALRWSPGHRGVDLESAPGADVRAPADGIVTYQAVVVDRGVVVLTHPDGLRTSLEPVLGTLPVGSAVTSGQIVGTVQGGLGHCAITCVHWGVRRGQTYLDPLSLLEGAGPAVLLPAAP